MAAPINLFDYEALARATLHPAVWDYVMAGAADEVTVAENRRAFDRLVIRPRVLADVSAIDMSVSVLGAADQGYADPDHPDGISGRDLSRRPTARRPAAAKGEQASWHGGQRLLDPVDRGDRRRRHRPALATALPVRRPPAHARPGLTGAGRRAVALSC